MEFHALLLGLALVWLASKVVGEAMERIGQTAVLGELLAGVVIGPSVLGPESSSDRASSGSFMNRRSSMPWPSSVF